MRLLLLEHLDADLSLNPAIGASMHMETVHMHQV